MKSIINADEVLAIAEQIERNGAKFYRRAADGFEVGRKKELLLNLAAIEDNHEEVFGDMRRDLTQFDSTDLGDQGTLYLKALAGGYVFDVTADPSEKLSGQERIEEILETALGLEKESVIYYLGIKEAVPVKLGQSKIDVIIKEEMGHIALLSKELAALRGELE
jgi:rubrerythrin